MARLQGHAALLKMIGADIEGYIGRWLQRLEQGPHLAGIAGAKLHQHPFPQGRRQLRRPRFQQGRFGAGEPVFGLLADRLKQP